MFPTSAKQSGCSETKSKEMARQFFHSSVHVKINLVKNIYPHGQWAVTVVHWLAQQTVSCQPGRGCKL